MWHFHWFVDTAIYGKHDYSLTVLPFKKLPVANRQLSILLSVTESLISSTACFTSIIASANSYRNTATLTPPVTMTTGHPTTPHQHLYTHTVQLIMFSLQLSDQQILSSVDCGSFKMSSIKSTKNKMDIYRIRFLSNWFNIWWVGQGIIIGGEYMG